MLHVGRHSLRYLDIRRVVCTGLAMWLLASFPWAFAYCTVCDRKMGRGLGTRSPWLPTSPSGQDLSSVIFLHRKLMLCTLLADFTYTCLCNHAPLPCSVAHVFLLWNNLDWSFYCKKICGWLCRLVFFVGSVASSCGHRWWDCCGGTNRTVTLSVFRKQ